MIQLRLKKQERQQLQAMTTKGSNKVRTINRVRILLLADKGKSSVDIAATLRLGRTTVWRTIERYKQEGLPTCLDEKPRPGPPRKYDEKQRAEVIALACTAVPEGAQHWSLVLLAETLHKRPGFKHIGKSTVGLILKKTKQNRG